jgi:hypothetical protein
MAYLTAGISSGSGSAWLGVSQKGDCRPRRAMSILLVRSPTRATAVAREGPEDLKDAAGPWRCPTRAVLAGGRHSD